MGLLDQVLGSMLGSSQRNNSNSDPSIIDALTSILAQGGRSEGGGLGGILGSLPGAAGDPRESDGARPSRVQNQGGLGELLDKFTRSGHGEIADSWVSNRENRPVAPHQLEEALGGDAIDKLSRQTGIPRDILLAQLSEHLPPAIDRLTPTGRRPTPEEMNHW